MKDEIKEILDDLRKTAENTIFVVCSSQEELDKMPKYTANFLSINDRKARLLLNYITNLQEENERYKRIFEGKERFSKIMSDDIDFIIMSKADYDRQLDDIELELIDYRSRNEKAIEYIKHEWFKREQIGISHLSFSYDELQHILNILKEKSD